MKREKKCSRLSGILRQQEHGERRLLRLLDGEHCEQVVITVAINRREDWEIEIRLPSDCIRRRNNKKK